MPFSFNVCKAKNSLRFFITSASGYGDSRIVRHLEHEFCIRIKTPQKWTPARGICLVSPCCLCPPDSASRNGTKRKQPADGQRSGAVAKRREVKRSRTGRTQALNSERRRQSAGFSRFRRNQRRSRCGNPQSADYPIGLDRLKS